jgi:autotransporter-associated beta strand protein
MVIGLGLCATLPVFGAGAFSQSGPLGSGNLDASVGLSASKTYTHAYNIYGGSGTTNINGVAFTNLAGANYTGVSNSFSMAGWDANLAGGDVIGAGSVLGFLLGTFNYKNGAGLYQQTLTLNNLVAGQPYILTFYNKSYGAAGGRLQALSSSGGAEGVFDEDLGGQPNANVLRYTFLATSTNEWVRFAALISNASYHLYGFSAEILSLTNNWTSGSGNWSAPNWSAGVPDGQNAQAVFLPQASPTTIQLDTPAKIGHLQMGGTNAYTLDGTQALTVWTDVGGAGVFNVVTGSHVIAVSMVLSNDMVKLGAGTLAMSGVVAGSSKVNVGAGALVLSGPNTYSGGTVINGGSVLTFGAQAAATNAGTVTVSGGVYDLGGFSVSNGMITMSSGTISNGTLTGKAYLFSGGTAYANLAGPGALTNKTGKAILYGANTYGGGTVITSGTLMLGAQAAATNAGAVMVSGGVYDLGGLEAVTNGVITMSSGAISNGTLAGASYIFSGGVAYANLSGAGALTNITGTTALYGTNTYSGGTAINSGMLSITNIVSLPGSDTAGRFSVASGGTLSVGNGVTDSNIAAMLGAGSFQSGANIVFDTSAGDRTCAVALTNAGTLGLVKSGNNTLTLSPAAATAGLTVKQGKVIVVSGTVSNNALNDAVGNVAGDSGSLVLQGSSRYVKTPVVGGAYSLFLGSASGSTGTLAIADSAAFQTPSLTVGNSGVGAVYQTGGTSVQTIAATIEDLMIGRNAGSYGFYALSGGSQSNAAQNLSIGYNGVGVYYQSGSSTQAGSHFFIGRGSGGTGVLYVTSGMLSRPAMGAYYGSDTGTCRGEWTMAGGTGTVNAITFGSGSASGSTGILNLNGGVLQVNAINQNQASALANLNFNGGKLQARQSSAGLLALNGNSGAYVYPGGAVIDDNGFNITIAQNLLAPSGSGVSGVSAFTPLGGYLGAPYVQISGGGGTGVTAVAVFDRASSNVTGIVVTSPGFSYTSAPTVTLVGGGKANYSLGTATLAANTSGGLTKLGAGTLKLSGLNTYTGPTTISNGTFRLGQPSALPANAAVVVAGGTYELGSFAVTNGAVTLSGGTIANGWLASASLTVSNTNASITASLTGNVRKTGNGTLTLRGAQSGLSSVTVAEGILKLADLNAAPPGAVACYRFDGTPADATGNNHTGTVEGLGSSYVSGRSVSAGQAINFTGSNDVAVVYAADLALNAYTVSAWVNLNTTPGTFGILGTRFNGENTFDLKVQSTMVHGDVGSGTGWLTTVADYNVAAVTNEWHMITYAVDNSAQNVRIYYDGVLAKTVAFTTGGTPKLMQSGQTLKIGADYPGEYMNGKMDDVFIFNNALSSDQVAQLYQEGVTPPTGILPVTANVTVDAGTTLDLNGHAQTLANLYGYGLVTNGALTVTGALAPGGTNAIGTLTLATIPTLSGTLLIDVATGGSCDVLQVLGSLNLVNVDLQIQDLGQLGFGKEYVIARFTPGSLTGRFQSNNLNSLRAIYYNNAAGEIRLVGRGTMISFK